MPIRWPPRLELANLPTPLQRLGRTGDLLGLDLWIKRDDLTGSALSGNKVRKLEFLVAAAREGGADTLVTCGAVTSNHARATAVAAARAGMGAHLLLRGQEQALPDGNLLLDRLLGAGVTFIDPEQWSDRERLMAGIAGQVAEAGGRAFVIPEGGSNALGAMGYAAAAEELLRQADEQGLSLRRIVHATGSGGTTAGLALGCAALGRTEIDVVGVAVCDDTAYFDGVISGILDDACAKGLVGRSLREAARWRILEGHEGAPGGRGARSRLHGQGVRGPRRGGLGRPLGRRGRHRVPAHRRHLRPVQLCGGDPGSSDQPPP
jgi:D-cysteine desulfhydrase